MKSIKLTLTAMLAFAACNVSAMDVDVSDFTSSTDDVKEVATTTVQTAQELVKSHYGQAMLAGVGIWAAKKLLWDNWSSVRHPREAWKNLSVAGVKTAIYNNPVFSGAVAGVTALYAGAPVANLAQAGWNRLPNYGVVAKAGSFVPSTETVKGYVPTVQGTKDAVKAIPGVVGNSVVHPVANWKRNVAAAGTEGVAEYYGYGIYTGGRKLAGKAVNGVKATANGVKSAGSYVWNMVPSLRKSAGTAPQATETPITTETTGATKVVTPAQARKVVVTPAQARKVVVTPAQARKAEINAILATGQASRGERLRLQAELANL